MRFIAKLTAVALIAGQILAGQAMPLYACEKGKVDASAVLTADNNAFAFDMYKKLALGGQGENVFFSPFSISAAMGMTYAGAKGNTEKQMASTLHFSLPQGDLHAAFSLLSDQLEPAEGKGYKLSIANALWGQRGYPFTTDFLSLVNKNYGGGFRVVDFANDTESSRQTINRWVESKTNDKIKDLLQQGDVTYLTRLVLTNAIYFKGDWAAKFKKEETRTAPFYVRPDQTVEVPMMRQTGRFSYAAVAGGQVLEMPYVGSELSMVVLLPKDGADGLGTELTPVLLDSWLDALSEQAVAISLPRFKLQTRYGLADTLAGMGMPDAFELPPADFSGMTGGKDLYITKVIHQAFIEVNEEGSEAAAATGVVMGMKSAPVVVNEFKADRPFVFLIRHKATGAILFLGRVANPVGK